MALNDRFTSARSEYKLATQGWKKAKRTTQRSIPTIQAACATAIE
jgi:hypothetical protein